MSVQQTSKNYVLLHEKTSEAIILVAFKIKHVRSCYNQMRKKQTGVVYIAVV